MGRVADTHKNNTAYEARTLAPFVACAPLFSLTPTHMSSSVPYPLPPSHPHHRHRCLPGTSYTTALRTDAADDAQPAPALGTNSSLFADTPAPSNASGTSTSGGVSSTKTQPSTLDKLHHTHVDAMVHEKRRFEALRTTLKDDRATLKALQARALADLRDAEMQQMFQLETAVADAEKTLAKYDKNGPFTDYFMETGDILFEYYENMDQISKGNDARRKRSLQSYSSDPSGKPTVIDFFRKKAMAVDEASSEGGASAQSEGEEDEGGEEADIGKAKRRKGKKKAQAKTKHKGAVDTETGDADDDDHQHDADADATEPATDPDAASPPPRPPAPPMYQSRQVLLNKYLEKTDPNYVPVYDNTYETLDTDDCPDCGTERFLVHYEATLVCPNPQCCRTDVILIDSYKPSYKDAPREGASYYSYKRINHFNEWLAQFQAKETTDIPDEVYHKIYVELKKERIENMAHITPAKMKEILKRLKLNKYYEHIPHITNRINGQPAPVMDRKTEEKLRSMFKEIQAPFLKHCPAERKNFLSYSYVLRKFEREINLQSPWVKLTHEGRVLYRDRSKKLELIL